MNSLYYTSSNIFSTSEELMTFRMESINTKEATVFKMFLNIEFMGYSQGTIRIFLKFLKPYLFYYFQIIEVFCFLFLQYKFV